MRLAGAEGEFVTRRQQHRAREDLRPVAHGWCARNRHPVADRHGIGAVEATVAHDAD